MSTHTTPRKIVQMLMSPSGLLALSADGLIWLMEANDQGTTWHQLPALPPIEYEVTAVTLG